MRASAVGASAVAALLATVVACGEDEPYLGADGSGGDGGCEDDCGPASLAGEGGAAGSEEDCSVEAQNSYVYSVMRRYYLWYDQVPEVSPQGYDSPQQLLDALMYHQLDRWSYISPAEQRAIFYEEGKFVGLGYYQVVDSDDNLRIAYTHPGSPAARAGLVRGDTILAIGQMPIDEIRQNDLWDTAYGANEVGGLVELEFEDAEGVAHDVTLQKQLVDFHTVHTTRVFDTTRGRVGYLLFNRFLGVSVDELRSAFAEFAAEGVSELVLDLRYNGGGLTDTAAVLASLVAGPELEGEVLVNNTYNDRIAELNTTLRFGAEPDALGLDRLVVIVGDATGSASELVINGLRPHLPVELIGTRTYGKPVGADSWEYCGQALTVITFKTANAEGESDYFDGLVADCQVPDDLTQPLGDPQEARLRAALDWIERGSCGAAGSDGGAGPL
jgi:carboxyl-terminal processing protease